MTGAAAADEHENHDKRRGEEGRSGSHDEIDLDMLLFG